MMAETTNSLSYDELLRNVQEYFSQTYNEMLSQYISSENFNDELLLKRNIEEYLNRNRLSCYEEKKMSALINRLFNSMCRYDFLTPYIFDDAFISEKGIKEINCNAWNCVFITDKTGTHRIEEHFPSPEAAIHTINALAVRLNKTLNDSTPKFLGEIRPNIRIASTISPITTATAALDFSIRIVSQKKFTREELIESQTLDDFGFSLLETFLKYKQSICIFGSPFSGKTVSMNYLLNYLANLPDNSCKRIITLEIEAREFALTITDEQGKPINNIISWCTREGGTSNNDYHISLDDLVELALRYNPEILGIGEMRNKEAMAACEIANAGITIITTTHSNSAVQTYERIVMLCKKAGLGYDDATLYHSAIKAFPVIAYQEEMDDGSHRITEIIEGIEYKDGKLIYNILYSFSVDSSSQQLVTGKYYAKDALSSSMYEALKRKGAPIPLLDYLNEGSERK